MVVAPADGQVCLIENAAPPPELGLGDEPRPRVSIFLSVLDAHVQRAPVGGEVVAAIHRPGLFGTADLPAASVDNERNSIVIRTPEGVDVIAVQIAGLVARRIICDVKVGDKVAIGDTYGLIRFGSRLDTYLPVGARLLVSVGQRAVAGETVRGRAAVRIGTRPEGPLRFLPSAMTVLAICLGLTSIKYALDDRPTEAMALIAAAAILDALDGRMARVLNATSKMGEEIDSLADAINFGVAPAFIVYALLLQDTPGGLDRRAALRGVHRAAAGPLQRPARRGSAGLHQAVLRRDACARAGRSGRSARWRPRCSSATAGGRRGGSVSLWMIAVSLLVVSRIPMREDPHLRGAAAAASHRCWRCWPSPPRPRSSSPT